MRALPFLVLAVSVPVALTTGVLCPQTGWAQTAPATGVSQSQPATAASPQAQAAPGLQPQAAPAGTSQPPAAAANRQQPPWLAQFELAAQAERTGQWVQAEQHYRQAIMLNPTDYLSMVKLAALLVQDGKPNEALSYYQKALLLPNADPMVLYSAGALYEQTGNYAQAESAYQEALKRNHFYRFGNFNLARVQMQQAKYDAAEQSFRQFLTDYPDHYEARKFLANVALVNHHEAEAVKEYETLKEKFPDRFDDSLNLARALNRSDAPERALAELQVAYAKAGNKADIVEEMGNAHMALGQPAYAVLQYQRAIDLDGARYPLYLKMADAHQQSRQPEQTAGALEKYLQRDPENAKIRHWLSQLYLNQKQYDQVLSQLTTLLNRQETAQADNPSERFALAKEIGYVYQLKGDNAAAIARYEALLSLPEAQADWQLRRNLALAYHQSGRLQEAVNQYQWVFEHAPADEAQTAGRENEPAQSRTALGNDLANALVSLGDQAYQAQRYDQAIQLYQRALQTAQPDNVLPWAGLGNAYFVTSQWAQGEAAYQRVLARQPEHVNARLYLAKIHLQRRDTEPAIALLNKLQADVPPAEPEALEIQLVLGDALSDAGRPVDAAQAYEKARALQASQNRYDARREEQLLLSEGHLWQSAGQFEKARAAYEKALSVGGDNPKIYYNLGIVLNELNQLGASVEAYNKALSLDPGMSDSQYGLAVTYEKQQKYQDALETYQRYIQHPNANYAQQASERIELLRQALGTPAPSAPSAVPAPSSAN